MKITNYREFYIQREYNQLILFLEQINESFFDFDAIYNKIKNFVTNLLNNVSNPFETIFKLWNKLKFSRKIAYIMVSVLMIGCGISKQEILKNFGYDRLAEELANEVELNSRIIKHTVEKGETLIYISNIYDVSYQDVKLKNKLNSDVIKPGQVLLIPSKREIEMYRLDQTTDLEEVEEELTELEKSIDSTKLDSSSSKVVIRDGFFFEESKGKLTPHSLIKNKRVEELELVDFKKVNAVVLHRTATRNLVGTLRGFRNKKIGTHFLIGYDGKIYQTASVNKMCYHVGEIRSKDVEKQTATDEELEELKDIGWSPRKVHLHEIKKKYPDRYPHNVDAIGIEVMGGHDGKKWEKLTDKQVAAVKYLLSILKNQFNLTDEDIYAHEIISYKTTGEGMEILTQITR